MWMWFLTFLILIVAVMMVVAYIPSVDDFLQRLGDGQWFVVGAERKGDALVVDVTARGDAPSSPSSSSPTSTPPGSGAPASASTTIGPGVPALPSLAPEIVNTPEVFLVQDNIYSYDEAEPLCRAYGSRLATMGDMYDAWKKGADWCSYGWVKGNKAVYPTQKAKWIRLQKSEDDSVKNKCGLPGLNGGLIRDPYARFGVHCFGVKPPVWKNYLANNMARENLTAQEMESRSQASKFRKQLNKFTIVPFSQNRWSDVYTTNDDSQMAH